MTELPAKLVVRRAMSRGTLVLASIAALAGVAALCVVYELGRYEGGFDVLAAGKQRSQFMERTTALERENAALRKQIAELDTMRVGREQERAELARAIGALQSEVASQSQQLAFYRGLVSHGQAEADLGTGLEIQELHITAHDPPGRFEVHLMLLETAHPQAAVSGTYQLSVQGQDRGKPQTLQFAALTDGKQADERFSFRYFQSVQIDIALPSGFAPEHLTVELRAGGKGMNPLIQTFPWKVDAS
jgi:Family of unknown function (DUF6776)